MPLDEASAARSSRPASPAAAGVALVDAAAVVRAGDPAFADLLTVPAGRLPGLDLAGRLSADDLESVRSATAVLLSGEATAAVVDVSVAGPSGAEGDRRPVRLTCSRGPQTYVLLVAEDRTALQDVAAEVRLLHGLVRDSEGGATPDLALSVALRRICTSVGWDAAQLWMPAADGALHCAPSWFAADGSLADVRRTSLASPLVLGAGLPGEAWATRTNARTGGTRHPGTGDPRRADLEAGGVTDVLAVPVMWRGTTIAVLELLAHSPRAARAVQLAGVAAAQLAPTLAVHAAEQALAGVASPDPEPAEDPTRDPLTGMIGALLLRDRVLMAQVRSERHDSGMAVFAIHLDGLASVNTSHTRRSGDRVLLEAADRLLQAMRSTDTCARIGPESFVIVCEDIDARLAAYPVADRLVSALSQPYPLDDGSSVRVTASVGVAMCEGPFESVEALLARTDLALARAREFGGGRAVVDATMVDGQLDDGVDDGSDDGSDVAPSEAPRHRTPALAPEAPSRGPAPVAPTPLSALLPARSFGAPASPVGSDQAGGGPAPQVDTFRPVPQRFEPPSASWIEHVATG